MRLLKKYRYEAFLALAAALLFMPFLGAVHLFDWDEINFAECSREMIETGDYLRVHLNYLPFWEKPPLFFWMQVTAMKIFGVGDYAARFPNAFCGLLTLILLFRAGRKLFNPTFGLIWAGLYAGSILPHFYFRSGIIDPWFNLFIGLSIYYFILFVWKKGNYESIKLARKPIHYLLIAGFWAGAAVLTKGPAGFLIIALTVFFYMIFSGFKKIVSVKQVLIFGFTAASLTFLWYGIETAKNGFWFLTEFIKYQIHLFSKEGAGHGGFPGYHFVVLFFGCFPASVFALKSFGQNREGLAHRRDFSLWMKVLFWVVLILFSIVQSKIVHYSSMCYFPLTFLGAYTVYNIVNQRFIVSLGQKILLLIAAFPIAFVLIALPFLGMNIDKITPYIKGDPFALANFSADVKWAASDSWPGVFFVLILIAFFVFIARKSNRKAFAVLLSGTALTVVFILGNDIGRIEAYSQRAAIDFYDSVSVKDCYIYTYDFKSYAHHYYGRVKPGTKPVFEDPEKWKNFLLTGPSEKDVYFVRKVKERPTKLDSIPGIDKLYEKNGFVFYLRKVNDN